MKWNFKADCLKHKDKENEDEFAFTLQAIWRYRCTRIQAIWRCI